MLGVSLFLTLRKKEMIYKFQVHISNKDLYPQETLDVINILSDIPRDIFFRLFPFMKLILKYQTGKDILPIDWRPRSELDSKYNLGSKSYDKTRQVSGQ